jgi:hypothetical protein
MRKTATAIYLMFASSTVAAADLGPFEQGQQLGQVAFAVESARMGAYTMVELCEQRFPDMKQEGADVRVTWDSRNAESAKKYAIIIANMRDRIQILNPQMNIEKVLEGMGKSLLPATADYLKKELTKTLASLGENKLFCQRMFGEIKAGKLDIKFQPFALEVLNDKSLNEFLERYRNPYFRDGSDQVQASGTWLGYPIRVNVAEVTADKAKNELRIDSLLYVGVDMDVAAKDQKTYPIESWENDVIRTVKQRAGTSERFLQYVVDRKAKTVSMVFSGEMPMTHILGDARRKDGTAQAK